MLILDLPFINSKMFFPRKENMAVPGKSGVFDGSIPVKSDTTLGYRLFANNGKAIIVYFHGNGETAADYDDIAPYYARYVDASLLVIDYRGYGWSLGNPTLGTLLSDTEAVFQALPEILRRGSLNDSLPIYVMGRSLGSAPAIHLVFSHPNAFRGLVIESGFASLFSTLHMPVIARIPDGLRNLYKLHNIHLPTLVIHGEQDQLLPIAQGEKLFEASISANKTFVKMPKANHNTVASTDYHRYFNAIADFINVVERVP